MHTEKYKLAHLGDQNESQLPCNCTSWFSTHSKLVGERIKCSYKQQPIARWSGFLIATLLKCFEPVGWQVHLFFLSQQCDHWRLYKQGVVM
jgi:hypothetical protein